MNALMLGLPACAVLLFVAFKLPPKAKDWFFKVPVWMTATAISWGLGHFMVAGVMGPYAILVMDLVLTPGFWAIKKSREKAQQWRSKKSSVVMEKQGVTA